MKFILSIGLLVVLFPVHISYSERPFAPQIVHAQEVVIETASSSVSILINKYAEKYSVPSTTMYKIVDCETGSTFDPKIQSFVITKGVREDSWGLSQIHLPDWPSITRTQAQDPDFALDFLASKLKEGKGRYWTCWRTQHEVKLNH